MSYETGTASDVNDLLAKLRTFALANGWSQDFSGARTSGAGNALQINKGGFYVTFRSDNGAGSATDPGPYIGGYAHGTYSAGNGTENQAGASASVGHWCNGMTGPFVAYHFISNTELGAEYLYCVVEISAGTFKHFGTGVLVKIGAITNGQFIYASTWNYSATFINSADVVQHSVPFDSQELNSSRIRPSLNCRVDADTTSPRWMDGGATSTIANRSMRGGMRLATGGNAGGQRVLMDNAASALTGRNMIYPCFLYAERTGGLFNPLGYPPGIRWVKLAFLEPNAVLTIGTDQWKVFPVIRKNGGVGQVNSGVYGYAYKVN